MVFDPRARRRRHGWQLLDLWTILENLPRWPWPHRYLPIPWGLRRLRSVIDLVRTCWHCCVPPIGLNRRTAGSNPVILHPSSTGFDCSTTAWSVPLCRWVWPASWRPRYVNVWPHSPRASRWTANGNSKRLLANPMDPFPTTSGHQFGAHKKHITRTVFSCACAKSWWDSRYTWSVKRVRRPTLTAQVVT